MRRRGRSRSEAAGSHAVDTFGRWDVA